MLRFTSFLALLFVGSHGQNSCLGESGDSFPLLTYLGFNTTNNEIGALPVRLNRVEDVNLRLYNGKTFDDYVDIPIGEATKILETSGFIKDNPTVVYAHGFLETAQMGSVQVVVSTYMEVKPDTNVILIDWSNMAYGPYFENAAGNTKKVGKAASEALHKLIEGGLQVDKLHIIGHSLGSHLVGYVARNLKNNYNETVKRLTALAPAIAPFYPDNDILDHINAGDAEFVDAIHTDAGLYGSTVATATADFWPNGGIVPQPGCPTHAPVPLSANNICSHQRSWRFFAESIRNPQAFPASPAESYQKFTENKMPENGMVYMGINCDTRAKGSYYLTTNAQEPFGRGINGIKDPQ